MGNLVARLFVLVMAFAVTACSGGGGGEQSSSPVPPPPDGTYLVSGIVTEVTPTSGYDRAFPGVTLTVNPGGTIVTTGPDGRYEMRLRDGDYTITPSHDTVTQSHGFRTFSPTVKDVNVRGADVLGVDFTQEIPTLERIDLFLAYIGIDSVGTRTLRIEDLLTGSVRTLMQNPDIQPMNLIPFREGGSPRIAFDAAVGGTVADSGIRTANVSNSLLSLIVPDSGFFVPEFASTTMGRDFDTFKDPVSGAEYVALSSPCAPGAICPQLQNDVFIVIADGSLVNLRVTFDGAIKRSPSFGGRDPVTGHMKVFYFKPDTGEIWQQIIDPTVGTLVGGPTIYRPVVMEGVRTMSVSQDYAHIAFMGNVNGQSHIIVKTLATGEERDLGPGSDPHFVLDGSGLLMYSDQNLMFAIYPDGTAGKLEVLVPVDLYPGTLPWMSFVSTGP